MDRYHTEGTVSALELNAEGISWFDVRFAYNVPPFMMQDTLSVPVKPKNAPALGDRVRIIVELIT